MPYHRSTSRRFALIALGTGIALSVAVLNAGGAGTARAATPATANPPLTLPDSFELAVEYAGIGAEGVDLIWRGQASGRAPGQVTVRMEYAGTAEDRAMPVWPVNIRLFYSADDYRGSFAAELNGSMNWRTGEMLAGGVVSDGARLDAPLEHRLRIRRPGMGGTVTVVFLSRLALLRAVAGGF